VTATVDAASAPDGADAFMVLGLPYSPDLTDGEVRAAYLLRMRAVHPGLGGDAQAAAAVTAAYDAVRSAVRRGELLAAVTIDRESQPRQPPRRAGRLRPGRPARRPASAASGDAPGTGRIPDAARREELRRQVTASRAAQGLPPYITDTATLDKIADLLVVTLGRAPAARRDPQSAGAAAGKPTGPPPWQPSAWRLESRRRYAAELEQRRAARAPAQVSWPVRGWLRVRYGRPLWLAGRVVIAALVVLIAQLAAPGDPAVPALAAGAATWLIRTGRYDLAPPARSRN